MLGVDDFALRRGHHYGTFLIDIENRRPVDVLADRAAETLAGWLRAHPGVEIVSRDRAGAYAEGVTVGAPDALQSRTDGMSGTTSAKRSNVWSPLTACAWAPPPIDTDATPAVVDLPQPPQSWVSERSPARTDKWAVRTRECYAAVHTLLGEGLSLRAIGVRLGLARGTVRRFARARSKATSIASK
ncbi:transposase [Nocardia carnea]|uniref:transposase n=1 Tax=Nocardia carnea TaxID=37328 RepID=UPI002453D244|nr:transposase [Nocardia carnea]